MVGGGSEHGVYGVPEKRRCVQMRTVVYEKYGPPEVLQTFNLEASFVAALSVRYASASGFSNVKDEVHHEMEYQLTGLGLDWRESLHHHHLLLGLLGHH